MDTNKTLYSILQVSDDASDEVIRAAYLYLVKKYHPDSNLAFRDEATAITEELNHAYSVLSNHADRAAYDARLRECRKDSKFSTCPPAGPSKKRANERFSVFLILFCATIIVWSIFQFGLGNKKYHSTNSSSTSLSDSTESTYTTKTHESSGVNNHDLTPPVHGYFLQGGNEVTYHDEYISGFYDDELYAPFEIKPPYDDALYLVKIKNIWTPDIEYQIFVHGGQTPIEVNLLCGSYILCYATGSTWYGKTDLFGPETRYYKSDDAFRLYHDGRNVCGQSITLYETYNGNLLFEEISADEF